MTNPKSHMNCMCYVIVFGIVLIISEICTGLKKGPNVCEEYVEDRLTYFCCFNYYLIDDHCLECKNGTTSADGLVCQSCHPNFFGHKCKYECSCGSHQRCDPEFGCLNIPTASATFDMSSLTQSENDPLFTTAATDKSESGTSERGFYLMLKAAGLISWLILCWTCSRLCYQRIRPARSAPQLAIQSQQPVPICQGQEASNNSMTASNVDENLSVQNRSNTLRVPIKSQHIYDYADEISLNTPIPAEPLNSGSCQATSAVSINSDYSASYTCDVVQRETYLHQYHSLKDKRETKIHDYTGIDNNMED